MTPEFLLGRKLGRGERGALFHNRAAGLAAPALWQVQGRPAVGDAARRGLRRNEALFCRLRSPGRPQAALRR